jgi:dephospho-CoA kinase
MRIIGITGGVASGKSLAAEQFAALGAGVLDADRAGHEALQLPHVEAAARQRWGDAIFGVDGRIERAKLAQIVFGAEPKAKQERKQLEQLTHPEIGRLLMRQAETFKTSGIKVAVVDAALLCEAGWDEMCEKTVFVDAPRDVRQARALARGWTKEEFAAREDAQDSLQRKRSRADVIIDNSGSAERMQAQIERFWASLFR